MNPLLLLAIPGVLELLSRSANGKGLFDNIGDLFDGNDSEDSLTGDNSPIGDNTNKSRRDFARATDEVDQSIGTDTESPEVVADSPELLQPPRDRIREGRQYPLPQMKPVPTSAGGPLPNGVGNNIGPAVYPPMGNETQLPTLSNAAAIDPTGASLFGTDIDTLLSVPSVAAEIAKKLKLTAPSDPKTFFENTPMY